MEMLPSRGLLGSIVEEDRPCPYVSAHQQVFAAVIVGCLSHAAES